MHTLYDFEAAISDLLDNALNELPPEQFERLLDSISIMLADYD